MNPLIGEHNKHFNAFLEQVTDIIDSPAVQKLDKCSHHYRSTRLQHCINVAYYSFLICRKLGWDSSAAARGGLLHDLFYYECKNVHPGALRHAVLHPKIALRRAERLCRLTPVERDIILKHMFIPSLIPPKYKESLIVCLVDKYCAIYEAFYGITQMLKLKFAFQ